MDQTLVLLILIVAMGGFMFWSQWRSRRRYQKRMEQLQTGDEVVTIGGIHGKLTYLDRTENRARLEVAPGVEVHINLGAVSHRISPAGEEE